MQTRGLGRPWRRMVVLAAVQTALLFAPAAASDGTNFGSQGAAGTGGTLNGVWLTTDSNWTVTRMNLTTAYYNAVTNKIGSEYSPTDLNVFLYTSTYCSDAEHDLCVMDSNYGNNGLLGWNACAGSVIGQHPTQKCSVDWGRINLFFSPPANRIACHEMGHAVGLRHTVDQSSCLKPTSQGGTSEFLTDHDQDHLDAQY